MKTCVLKNSATIVQSPQMIPSLISRRVNVRRRGLSAVKEGSSAQEELFGIDKLLFVTDELSGSGEL
jgi:hypothetical protein